MKKAFRLLVLLLAMSVILSGCGGSGAPTSNATSPSSPGASSEGPSGGSTSGAKAPKDTLVIAVGASPSDLDGNGKNDSASLEVRLQIYETLLATDNRLNVVPGIAESWEYKDDTTIVFKIREGVLFHDGTPLTAEDVAFSIQRGDAKGFTGNYLKAIDFENSKATGEYEYTLKLLYPFAPILQNLTAGAAGIMSKAYVESHDDDYLAKNTNGTGPYMLDKWIDGDRIELVKNHNYWRPTEGVEHVIYRFISEAANRAIEIEVGGVDIAFGLSPNDALRLRDNPNVRVDMADNVSTTYIGFNYTKPDLKDKRVRQAVRYALDLESIVDAVYFGLGRPGISTVAPAVWGFSDNVPRYDYDPEKAKQLLAEAGYPNGFKTKIWTSDNAQRMTIAEIMQNQLAEVGIEAEVEVLEWGNYLVAIQNKELDIYLLGMSATTGDADILFNQHHSTSPFSGNTGYYSNPELDKLLEQTRLETVPEKRLAALEKAQQLIMEELPWIPVWHGVNAIGVGIDVEGFEAHPAEGTIITDVHFK